MSVVPFAKEIHQSLVRLGMVTLMLLYYSIHEHISKGTFFSNNSLLLVSILLIAAIECLWAVKCSRQDTLLRQQVYFRIITNFLDNALLGVAMTYLGVTGAPLFLIYLWITFGIGLRYGGKYLIFSAVLNCVSFCTVVYIGPIWTSGDNLYISIGILLSLIMLPAYVYALIAKLADTLEAEKNANRIKGVFFANMSHELRTPLNSILNATDVLQIYKMPPKIYEMVDVIRAAANTQLQIVNRILDIFRIEAGQYKFKEYAFNLYALVFEIKQLFFYQAERKGIRFFAYIDPRCNQHMIGAGAQIKQVLINLVGNAVKFTNKGFVRLSISAGHFENDRQQIIFQIEDSGIGIDEPLQKQIFKPFTQAEAAITRKYGGTGLGLTISDELVKLIGGKLRLESVPGIGTVFTFTVSLCVEHAKGDQDLKGVKLCPVNLEDGYSGVIDFYADQGIEIIKPSPGGKSSISGCIDNRTIIIHGKSSEGQEGWNDISNLKDRGELVVIKTLESKENPVSDAVTSVSPDFDKEVLLNAVRAGIQFLPKYPNKLSGLPFTSRSLNILLAEDDKTLREVQQVIFAKAGHTLTVVSNGKDALSMLANGRYDLAIFDLHLPDFPGWEIASKYIKSTAGHARLILLTADPDNPGLTPERKQMFSLILAKPIEPERMLAKIYGLFGLPVSKYGQQEYADETGDSFINHENNHCLSERSIEQKARFFGKEVFAKVLNIYDKEINSLISELSATEGNSRRAHDALHQIKGASLSLGAYELGMAAEIFLEIHEEADFKYHEYLSKLHKEFINCARSCV